MIYYNSVQWDLHLLYTTVNDTIALETPHSSLWNESIHNFEKNVNNRLDEIIFHAHRLSLIHGKLANVGIRTAPVNPRPSLLQSPLIAPQNRLILALNNVLRMMARDRNITLYDMDNDIWWGDFLLTFLQNEHVSWSCTLFSPLPSPTLTHSLTHTPSSNMHTNIPTYYLTSLPTRSSVQWKFNTHQDEIMRDFNHPTAEKGDPVTCDDSWPSCFPSHFVLSESFPWYIVFIYATQSCSYCHKNAPLAIFIIPLWPWSIRCRC